MKETQYFAPDTLDEALGFLKTSGKEITILAGGSDVVPSIALKGFRPAALMYLGNLGLSYIEQRDGHLAIGAATTWREIADSPEIEKNAPALAQAARVANTPGIKSTATIGGNLQTASPAADLAPPLLVMDARVVLRGSRGARTVELEDFYLGIGKTVRKDDEIIEEILVPRSEGKSVFVRIGRRKATTLSIISAAARMIKQGDTCSDIRVSIGCAAPTPIRCREAEKFMAGKKLDRDTITSCAEIAAGEMRPRSSSRTSPFYRKKAGLALLKRAIGQAAGIDMDSEG